MAQIGISAGTGASRNTGSSFRRFPLGSSRAPDRGWVVFEGRRGHYDFCDEFRAYDLATGTAYFAGDCSALVVKKGGDVDHAATDARRKVRTHSGRVSVDNLREAVWIALLAPAVESLQPESLWFPLPEGMSVEWPRRDFGGGTSVDGGSGGGDSGQTELAYRWSENREGPRGRDDHLAAWA